MLFRVSKSSEINESYGNVQAMKSMIYMVLTSTVNSILSNYSKDSSVVYDEFKSNNYPKEFRQWIIKMITSQGEGSSETILVENIIESLIVSFLEGKNVDGSKNNAINTVLNILSRYNPDKPMKGVKDDFTLKESKYGIIYYVFDKYRLTNTEYTNKEIFENIRESGRTNDEGDVISIFDTVGVEENFLQNFSELDKRYICQDIYDIFFVNDRNEIENISKLCEAYNLALANDLSVIRRNKEAEYTFIPRELLNKEEWDRIEYLVDESYYSEYVKIPELNRLEKFRRLFPNMDQTEIDKCTLFFSLLVKSDINLKLRNTQYFKNTSVLKMSNVRNLDDFKRIMRSTSNLVQKYPEFPLLRDTSLERLIVDKNKIKRENIPDRIDFEKQLRDGSKVNEVPALRMSKYLKEYLSEIVNEKRTHKIIDEDESNIKYDYGLVWIDGKVDNRDVEKCLKLIQNPEEISIVEYIDLYEALTPDNLKLNPNLTKWMLEEKFKELLEGRTGKTNAIRRLNNIWELTRKTITELIKMESQTDSPTHQPLESGKVIDYFQLGKFKLLKVRVDVYKTVIVNISNQFPLFLKPPEYREGQFEYKGINHFVNVDSNIVRRPTMKTLDLLNKESEVTRELARLDGINPNKRAIDFREWMDLPLESLKRVGTKVESQGIKEMDMAENESIMDINDFINEF